MIGLPISTRCSRPPGVTRVALEEVEQLRAALVLVDAADVDREPIADAGLLPEPRPRSPSAGISEPTPTTTPGTWWLPATAWMQRALLERVVHERADAAEDRPEDRQPERAVALGRRHEDRLLGHRAHAVVRVVVAEAEEDEEVVVRLRSCRDVLDQRGAGRPFGVEPGQLVVERVRASRTRAPTTRAELARDRARATPESGAPSTPFIAPRARRAARCAT